MADNLVQNAAGHLRTDALGRTIDVLAANAITMNVAANATTNHGDIRYQADTGDITLGTLNAGTGDIALIATLGSILDLADAGAVDVVARQLLVVAGGNIGSGDNHVETAVDVLAARASGTAGLFLTETDTLLVDNVAVEINRVAADTTTAPVASSLSDLVTTNNGSIVLRTLNGNITLNDGTVAVDNIAVSADGTGNLLIEAADAAGDITANADLLSGTGHITVLAGHDLTFASTADVITSAAGTLNLVAGTGSLTQPGQQPVRDNHR